MTESNQRPNLAGYAEPEIRMDDFGFVYLDVDSPPIAWLVYRGVLNSCDVSAANPGNLSWFLVDTIKRGLTSTLRREGLLEGFRAKEFPGCLSRLRCVYAYPTLEAAKRGNYGRGKFRLDNLVAIAPVGEYRREFYDSSWIDNFDSLPPETARKYWSGEPGERPLHECLLSGRFFILGTSVRTRAYDTIRRTWPNSLAMLELSRLAVEFGSDLGSVSPWLMAEADQLIVKQIIRYSESEGLEIFRQALEKRRSDPSFQANWADLEPLCTSQEDPRLDARFSGPDCQPYFHQLREDKLAELNEFIQLALTYAP